MEGTEEVIEGAMVAAEVDTMARDLLILKLWLIQRQLLQVIHTTEDVWRLQRIWRLYRHL